MQVKTTQSESLKDREIGIRRFWKLKVLLVEDFFETSKFLAD